MPPGCVIACCRESGKRGINMIINKKNNLIYSEKLTSWITTRLFLILTVIFLLLLIWRINFWGMDTPAIVFACIFFLFLFYVINYRTLQIRLTDNSLQLIFGIFHWTEELDNIETCSLDQLPAFYEKGGAGIHFMMVNQRYRASFNFLEYPRVVIGLKKKRGWVRDLSFSTRQLENILQIIGENIQK